MRKTKAGEIKAAEIKADTGDFKASRFPISNFYPLRYQAGLSPFMQNRLNLENIRQMFQKKKKK